MTKKKKEVQEIQEAGGNMVYIFHNSKFGMDLFMNAQTAANAMEQFDRCAFENRNEWRISVELPNQPSGGSNES